ncbi:MAG: hypothetical protein QF440_05945 [Candidatus Thalassarchaeaceae archaeon]|jgi:phosphoglucosamine mutase|nr:hypothetical protein [Candidatus Thalassarchaeaceae archaeon]
MAHRRLHGTDGIRGRIESFEGTDEGALIALVDNRVLSNRSMRIIGEATGLYLCETIGDSPLVLIGWDRRDGNAELVDALESGLLAAGCRSLKIGELPTPGLHYAILGASADAGMMVTASHNPATDSGVKLFDQNGYKSMPDTEDRISSLAWSLADGGIPTPQNGGITLEDIDGLELYKRMILQRLDSLENLFGIKLQELEPLQVIPSKGILLDSSGGATCNWLSNDLVRYGLPVIEVSRNSVPINQNGGAGGLSPTDSWTLSELLDETFGKQHDLLSALAMSEDNTWKEGQIIGAALDGDGDRCLLIEATSDGIKVVDGDRICDDILRAVTITDKRSWQVATSIESDLGLVSGLNRMKKNHQSITTAVGDRWLSAALSSNAERIFFDERIPAVIGSEDSGHLVLASPYSNKKDVWSLVGDGVGTMLAALLARGCLMQSVGPSAFQNGWKKRVSISPSERKKWDGENKLSDLAHSLSEEWCKCKLNRINIEGEQSLLLLTGELESRAISIAIRNSGTEAKTAISIRFAPGVELEGMELMKILLSALEPHLKPS